MMNNRKEFAELLMKCCNGRVDSLEHKWQGGAT